MGKIRTKTIGLDEVEEKQKEKAKVRREQKKKRLGEKEKPTTETAGVPTATEKTTTTPKTKQAKKAPSKSSPKKTRGAKYQEAQKYVDRSKTYTLTEAIVLLKKIHFTRFDETVELHLNVKDVGFKKEVTLPHGTGKEIRVAICDETVIDRISRGIFDFDILIARPSDMAKLVKYAKVLGPKGVMPNPKNGTLTDKPETAVEKFKKGAIQIKTEVKFPLIHQSVGKLSFTDAQLTENIEVFFKAVSTSKINSIFLKSTMSPSIKLLFE